ncbi:sensor histidine kinase [Vibrio mediterranei]|uniref:sensor histidine kinase n=1 Tax=Vibrio mediterranei TaxID=689 RepID=UPI00148E77CA|nr:ATP-binding protein [Vibrio mediterranei]NOI22137.1 PAS domain-containing protein [Vibrio mediterranei]
MDQLATGESQQDEQSSSHLDSLESQVERYQQVIEAMPAGVILLDTQGVVREANPEAHRILDIPLVGQKWFHLIQVVFDPKEDDGHEVSLRNGRKVRLAISASSTGQLILITDLTETRLLQSRVSDLQRLSSLGRMVASLAHHTLKQLVDEYQPMVETTLKSNNIDYCLEVEQDEVALLGNVNAVASALSNLVLNAVQIAGKGSQLDVFFRPVNNELKISVQDSGPGVPAELQQKIMEPFFTTRSQGTGLGLAVVQMVCRAHEGRLELISEEDDGACFTMCLPLATSSQEVTNEGIS